MTKNIETNLAAKKLRGWNTFHWTWGCESKTCEDTHSACVKTTWDVYRNTRGSTDESNWQASQTQEVSRFECDRAEIQCCAAYEKTLCKELSPEVDLCAGKQVNCPINCKDNTYLKEGACNKSTGACSYGYVEKCAYGCDFSTGECAKPPADKCAGVRCQSSCVSPKNNYATAVKSSYCDKNTGKCIYENVTCSAGCTVMPNGDAKCNEDCDNGIDDDEDGLVDCADKQDCSTSLYCSCKMIGSNQGKTGGNILKVLIGGYNFDPPTFFLTSKTRDADAEGNATLIMNAIKAAEPFNEMNMIFYSTRLPSGDYFNPWPGELIDQCKDVGGDFTFMVDFNDASDSYSRYNSMNAYMFVKGIHEDFGKTAVHEMGHGFAGLWDEYIVIKESGFLSAVGGTIRDAYFTSRHNCAVVDNAADCKSYFDKVGVTVGKTFKCVQGCTNPLWYRSDDTSIMQYPKPNSVFNEVSKRLIRDKIQAFSNPRPLPAWTTTSAGGQGWEEQVR